MKFFLFPKNIVVVASLASTILLVSASILSDNGKAGYTGSPVESTCATSGCHSSFSLNSGGGSVTITSVPAMTNDQYVPGTAYAMSVTVSRTGSNVFGLGVEVLGATNTNAGVLAVTNSTQTRIAASGGRTNIVHQLNGGLVANTKTFSFKWTAPASGNATFYAGCVAGNNNGNNSGDYVYTKQMALTPAPTLSIKTLDKASLEFTVYPNPATDRLTVNYKLNEKAQIVAKLYSLQGAWVADLLDEKQEAGTQKMSLALPKSLSVGTYLLKLSINGHSVVQRIVKE